MATATVANAGPSRPFGAGGQAAVLPILFSSAIYLSAPTVPDGHAGGDWHRRVLPTGETSRSGKSPAQSSPLLAVTTAARANPTPPRMWSRPHSPCSRSDIRLAGRVTTTAGGLLPHRFTHHLQPPTFIGGRSAGLLSVAVVVTHRLPSARPRLRFREATLPLMAGAPGRDRSRPVPR